jgi:2-polyprenyl-3-methyl-5-hydroxy-6-metoxy-1,4-benzoquinol methylase
MAIETRNPPANNFRADADKCPLCGSREISDLLRAPDRFHWRPEVYQLLRCRNCECAWLPCPPAPEEMPLHYDQDYHNAIVAGGESSASERWQRHRRRISEYKKGGAILDIGCSSGAFLGTMKNDAWKLYGIELEASTAERAMATTGAEVFVGDVMDAPFAPESFDVITNFDLLEHVYDARQFLFKVREWLKPGGIYYVTLPNIDSWEARIFGSYWYGLELPRHLFHFSPRSLRKATQLAGLQEVCMLTPPTTYVERSIGYVSSRVGEMLGFAPVPQAKAVDPGIPGKIMRRAMRLALVKPFGYVASVVHVGGSIEAMFRNETSGNGRSA